MLAVLEVQLLILFLLSSSDADSDVLADYVLALIRSDAPDEEIRKASIENLEDFLKESSSHHKLRYVIRWLVKIQYVC